MLILHLLMDDLGEKIESCLIETNGVRKATFLVVQ